MILALSFHLRCHWISRMFDDVFYLRQELSNPNPPKPTARGTVLDFGEFSTVSASHYFP